MTSACVYPPSTPPALLILLHALRGASPGPRRRSSHALRDHVASLSGLKRAVGGGTLEVVEVEEHGRMLGRRQDHVLELPEYVGANCVSFVVGDQRTGGVLAPEHVEVVVPERRHHFLELSLRVDGPRNTRGYQAVEDPSWAVLSQLAAKSARFTLGE